MSKQYTNMLAHSIYCVTVVGQNNLRTFGRCAESEQKNGLISQMNVLVCLCACVCRQLAVLPSFPDPPQPSLPRTVLFHASLHPFMLTCWWYSMPMLSVLTRMAIMIPRLKYLLSTILFSFSLKPSQVLTTLFLYSTTPCRLPRPRLPLRSPPWETDGRG